MIDLKKIVRKLVVQLEDAEGKHTLSITFFWLPAALTMRTLPNFVAVNDEPLAELQRAAYDSLLKKQETVEALKEGQVSVTTNLVTKEALEAEIEARRSEEINQGSTAARLAARKLLLLLDQDYPTDLTDNGEPLKADVEAFALAIPVELMEAVTAGIQTAMNRPFFRISGLDESTADTSST